jgi:hypothetical protein
VSWLATEPDALDAVTTTNDDLIIPNASDRQLVRGCHDDLIAHRTLEHGRPQWHRAKTNPTGT